MRGTDERTGALFSYVDLDARVRKDHPLRVIRAVVNEALGAMEREIASLYPGTGRPSIADEESETIYRAVRSFMKRLASRLDEQGTPMA